MSRTIGVLSETDHAACLTRVLNFVETVLIGLKTVVTKHQTKKFSLVNV